LNVYSNHCLGKKKKLQLVKITGDSILLQNQEDSLILKIIESNFFSEQKDIIKLLSDNGVDMPQATLSRRFKRLNINKINGVYKVVKQSEIKIVLEISLCLPNLIIIRTIPGHANSVAFKIDGSVIEGVRGTIAGDDTIFVAVEECKIDQVQQIFKRLLNV
jgi:transcriptional regulator of arginine metabolism